MKIKLTEKEINYLITIIEQEVAKAKHYQESENYMDMLHKLYQKLVITIHENA